MFGNLIETFRYLDQMYSALAGAEIYFDYTSIAYSTIITSAIIELVFFIFKGMGLYMLSKKHDISCAWLSFVPFASYVQMGRLVGEVKLFGKRTKWLGLFVAITLFIAQVCNWVYDFGVWYEPFKQMTVANTFDAALYEYTATHISSFMTFLYVFSTIIEFAYIVLWVFLIIAFFRYFEPKHPTLYALLSIFLNLTGIFVFVVRKNEKINYFEKQRQYYENIYRQQYKNGNGVNKQYSQSQNSQENSPFMEYSKKPDADVFTEYSQNDKPNSSQQYSPYDKYENNNPYNNNSANNDSNDEDLFS